MLSRPESSGLKPAPISINGATLPRIDNWPDGGWIDLGQQAEQRALARAVAPDDSHPVAVRYPERDLAQGPELGVRRRATRGARRDRAQPA